MPLNKECRAPPVQGQGWWAYLFVSSGLQRESLGEHRILSETALDSHPSSTIFWQCSASSLASLFPICKMGWVSIYLTKLDNPWPSHCKLPTMLSQKARDGERERESNCWQFQAQIATAQVNGPSRWHREWVWSRTLRSCLSSPCRTRSRPELQLHSLLPLAPGSLKMVNSCLLFRVEELFIYLTTY